MRFGPTLLIIGALLVAPTTGCSLVVDFDRSLLLDSGVDASADPGTEMEPGSAAGGGVDLGNDAGVDTRLDARPEQPDLVSRDAG